MEEILFKVVSIRRGDQSRGAKNAVLLNLAAAILTEKQTKVHLSNIILSGNLYP